MGKVRKASKSTPPGRVNTTQHTKVSKRRPKSSKTKRQISSSPSRSRQTRAHTSEEDDDNYTTQKVSKRTQATWKTLHEQTRTYLMELVNSNLRNVLEKTQVKHHELVEHTLGELKARLNICFQNLYAPVPKVGNYKTMESLSKTLYSDTQWEQKQLEKTQAEIERLENVVENSEARIVALNKEIREAQSRLKKFETNEVHPLLKSRDTGILLPSLPWQTFQNKIPDPEIVNMRSSFKPVKSTEESHEKLKRFKSCLHAVVENKHS